MALVTCPSCGKSISDSAKTCIHCGHKLQSAAENFYALPPVKQYELQREYSATGGIFPQDYSPLNKNYRTKLTVCIVFMVWFVMPLGASFVLAFTVDIILMTIAAVPICLIGILGLLLSRTISKHKAAMEKMINDRTNFEKWLKDTHNLTITWEWGTSSQDYLKYKQLKQKRGIK